MNDMIELAASLIETLLVVRLCNKSLDFKNRDRIWIKATVFFILLAAENILLGQRKGFENLSSLLFLLLVGGYVLLFFKGKIYEKLLISLFPLMMVLLINLLVMYAFRVLSGSYAKEVVAPGGSLRIHVLLFSKLAFFFVCEILIHMRKRVRYLLDGLQWLLQLSCFVVTFLITYLLWNVSVESDEIPLLLWVSTMLAVLNVLFYAIMGKMHRDSIIKEEYRVLKMNLAAQERFVEEAKERHLEMKTLRHDMRHYLAAAAELISADRADEAKDYMEKIINERVDRIVAGVDTGSVVIDAVINRRIAECAKCGIHVKCMLDSQLGGVSDTDLSIVLSNALDNAIRGCMETDAPGIELSMGLKKTFTYIVVKNTIAESVLSKNPRLETDKADSSIHGFGIVSMRKIADKYKGSVTFREEKGFFIVEIWLAGTREEK